MKLLTTAETAERLGVTVARVQHLIWAKRLPAQKLGRDWFIEEKDLALVADRKPGRPPMTDEEKATRAVKRAKAKKAGAKKPGKPAKKKAAKK